MRRSASSPRAWCIIEEGVAPAGRITLKTGVAVYPLHQSILRVAMATRSIRSALWRTSDARLRTRRRSRISTFDINNLSTAETGRPAGFATDAGTRQMPRVRIPTATENGLESALKVARLPIVWLSVDKPEGVPEVPGGYHELTVSLRRGPRAHTECGRADEVRWPPCC